MKKFDLTTIYNKDRPLSHSALSSFDWNPHQWYRKYVLKELPEITPELAFGSMIDKRIQSDLTFLPELERYPILQHEMRAVFNKIPLIGFADGFDRERLLLKDDKTGRKKWDQKRADDTKQLTMYAFLLYLTEKIKPEKMTFQIDWLPTHYEGNNIVFIEPMQIHTFKTKRNMKQVLEFGQYIKDTWAAMEEYCTRQQQVSHVKISKMLK